LFSWALGLALLISFVALAVLWPQPRLRALARGRPLLAVGRVVCQMVAVVGLALYLLSLAAGSFGENVVSQNLLPVTLYVTVWVGAQLAAGLIGDVWAPLNPIATIAGLFDPGGGDDAEPSEAGTDRGPDWGHWPATAGLVIFLFYELSHPTGSRPRTLALLLTAHLFGALIATGLWGAEWVRRNEPFTALFRSLAAMGPVFGHQGRLRIRVPLSGLSTMTVRAGTAAMLLTVIGGTSFDGFSESSIGRDVFDGLSGWTLAGWEFLGLLTSIAVVAALYGFGIWWTARVTSMSLTETWRAFAPSLVPIAFGYTAAHYFQLFVDNIQVFVFRLSDPFGWGWDLFGTADGLIWQIDPDVTAWIQVTAMLIGHVGAITVAHDRAVELFPGQESMRSQLAMVFVMIAYSSLGLWLLLTA
jgi:hypothetical protein